MRSGSKPNFCCSAFSGAEAPNVVMAMIRPLWTDIALPSNRRRLFDRDPRRDGGRQNGVAVFLRLLVEQLPAGHADDAAANALRREVLVSGDAEVHFAAGRQQQDVRRAARCVGKHVGAASDAAGRRVLGPVKRRQRLSREHQHGWLVAKLHDHTPGFGDFVGVARTQRDQARDRAQRQQLLDGLMGGPSSPTPMESCVKM